jgi:hypothetical protein
MRFLPALVTLTMMFSSCLDKDNEKQNGYQPDNVYHDYRISGEEGKEEVTIVLQHRLGGREEEPTFLEESKLSLDGMELKADSAKLAGTFYEVQRPAAGFPGKHTIHFTDNRGNEHKTAFTYQPFSLAEELPEKISKKPFTIRLKDFSAEPTPVQLVMVDTSFESKDINEEVIVKNGELTITEGRLINLALGPVTLELHYEKEIPLRGFSKKGGRILISYSLRRQFELVR